MWPDIPSVKPLCEHAKGARHMFKLPLSLEHSVNLVAVSRMDATTFSSRVVKEGIPGNVGPCDMAWIAVRFASLINAVL